MGAQGGDGGSPAPGLTWDDDEVETQIWDGYGEPPDDALAALVAPKAGPKPGDEPGLPPVPIPGPPSEVVAPVSPEEDSPSPLDLLVPPTSTPPPPDEVTPARDALADLEALAPVDTGPPPARSTVSMPPLSRYAPPPLSRPERKSGKLGVWIGLTLLVLALCGGALYYFLVLARQPGAIEITATPPDVSVSLDGTEQASAGTPLTINRLKPGFYVVSAYKPGFERWTKTVEVQGGKTTKVKPALLAQTSIKLYSNVTKAVAFLNGHKLPGLTPMRITRVVAGRNKLEVRKAPLRAWVHEFEIRQGTHWSCTPLWSAPS